MLIKQYLQTLGRKLTLTDFSLEISISNTFSGNVGAK